ncbi:MAG: hypothetical protein QXT58_00695 [Archaeoglobaceae archaeon]
MRKGMSLLEAIVSSAILAVLFSVSAVTLITSQKVMKREESKREGILIAFSVAQSFLASPFQSLPPEEKQLLEEQKAIISFPASKFENLFVTDEQGKILDAKVEDDGKTVSVREQNLGKVFIHYDAVFLEKGWKIKVKGEFITEELKPSMKPTNLKLLTITAEKGDVSCPPLKVIVGRRR